MRCRYFIFLGLVMAGCVSNIHEASRCIRLGKQDSGADISILVSDTLIISLATNPGLGCNWSVLNLDSEKLCIVGDRYVPDSTGAFRTGLNGTEVFSFIAKEIGAIDLKIAYYHPAQSAYIDSVIVHVHIVSDLPG
jgi:predicted secreted protein